MYRQIQVERKGDRDRQTEGLLAQPPGRLRHHSRCAVIHSKIDRKTDRDRCIDRYKQREREGDRDRQIEGSPLTRCTQTASTRPSTVASLHNEHGNCWAFLYWNRAVEPDFFTSIIWHISAIAYQSNCNVRSHSKSNRRYSPAIPKSARDALYVGHTHMNIYIDVDIDIVRHVFIIQIHVYLSSYLATFIYLIIYVCGCVCISIYLSIYLYIYIYIYSIQGCFSSPVEFEHTISDPDDPTP